MESGIGTSGSMINFENNTHPLWTEQVLSVLEIEVYGGSTPMPKKCVFSTGEDVGHTSAMKEREKTG
jgi:hypothetical protein